MSALVETYRGAVYPWHCDHMGHMNVMVCELTAVQIDAKSRKSSALPAEVVARARERVTTYDFGRRGS